MKINGLVVSVGYADDLARGVDAWMSGLESLTVVTAERDTSTIALCSNKGCRIFKTDSFWRDGAHFNKGRAIAEAFDSGIVPTDNWLQLIDADVVPPKDWLEQVRECQPGTLYGAKRRQVLADGSVEPWPVPDFVPVGFFLLFHGDDPGAKVRPIVDTNWTHAGNYDSTFIKRWERQTVLALELLHHGPRGTNWCGVGNEDVMNEVLSERARRGGWKHETITAR